MMKFPAYNNNKKQDLCKLLDTTLKGAVILGIRKPTQPEHIFVLKVKYPNEETQEIEFGATDMGWWVDQPFVGKHKFFTFKFTNGHSCEQCEFCAASSEEITSDDCPGHYVNDENAKE
jgi:hypothetical protein